MITEKSRKTAKDATEAMKAGAKKALEMHSKFGVPAVIMNNGKIRYIMPDRSIKDRVDE